MSPRRPRLGVGDLLDGRFELRDELGEGGMSRVYEAIDLRYDRPAAVKVLAGWLAEDEEFRQRFERESNAAERVNHPHVLPVWHHGEQGGLLYLVTPLCDSDLGRLLDEQGQLDARYALAVLTQVAWALDWAHGRGVVHRDVKPENILLVSGPSDHAYLADFGLAKARADDYSLTQVGHPAGLTPAYAAPEQWLGEQVGAAADQYALAATLYTCLAGHPPFHPRRGPSLREAHLGEPAPALDAVTGGVPRALAAAVARGLSKDPAERYDTCRDLITAAQEVLQPSSGAHVSLPRDAGGVAVPNDRATMLESEAARELPGPTEADPGAGAFAAAMARDAALPVPAGARDIAQQAPAPAPVVARPAADAVPSPGPGAGAAEPARPRRPLVIAAAAVGVIAIAVVAVLALGGGGGGGSGASTGVPPSPSAGIQRIKVGAGPNDLTAGSGGIWVANSGADTLTRIAPRDGAVRQAAIAVLANPFAVAVAEGHVWAAGGDGRLAEIDARDGRKLGVAKPVNQADGLAAGARAVWIINATEGSVTRVDVSSGKPAVTTTERFGTGSATSDIAMGPEGPWVANSGRGTLVRLDPATGATAVTVEKLGAVSRVAVGEGAVWATVPSKGQLLRVDPATRKVTRIGVGAPAPDADVAVGDGAVFYVSHADGTAARVDPRTNRVVGQPQTVTGNPTAAIVADKALWVADGESGTVARLRF